MRTLLLEEMTWPEVKAALEKGMRTVIVFAGAVEQHGPHLAEITDAARARAEAVDLAERLGNALVAPVIRPGISEPHMSLPGTISLRPEVFKGLMEDYTAAYVKHGFTSIVFGSTHGGNMPTMLETLAELKVKYPDVKFAMGYTMGEVGPVIMKCEQEEGLPKGACGSHACDFETSLMLLKDPELVHMENARVGWMGQLTPQLMEQMNREGIDTVSPTGVLGDPTMANATRGKRYFEAMQELQEKLVRAQLS